jgi:hypothetical protein
MMRTGPAIVLTSKGVIELISASFDEDVLLAPRSWPGNEGQLRGLLKEAIDSFITRINSG